MSVPLFVIHDPIAQAEDGLSGLSISNPQINGLALITRGFLWANGSWARCYDDVTTSWDDCWDDPVVTTWDDCYDDVVTNWDPCSPFDEDI